MPAPTASSVDILNPVERKLVCDALQLQIASYTRAARAAKTNEINAAYVNRKDSTDDLAKHPSDFDLYEIGSFDDSTGIIEVFEPRMLARAKDLKESV
ncbi:hypothetical protein AXG93_2785s1000 [Marchantia polymorpha subsp. ruderalis]|uniref:Uncharacterized protein n=1 Tax=Marchantia polymorpha subsp. ruderalis TaxID=1480154 RepID=A0A176VSG7_MARPO|nr:hypothetical protein AXG93_2785s1000 [Marchantia polymorpha subsp. ruderalis]